MRPPFTKMVLDTPDRFEAQLVGQLDLFESLRVDLHLGVALPVGVGLGGIGDDRRLEFVEKIEFHGGPRVVGSLSICTEGSAVYCNGNNLSLR